MSSAVTDPTDTAPAIFEPAKFAPRLKDMHAMILSTPRDDAHAIERARAVLELAMASARPGKQNEGPATLRALGLTSAGAVQLSELYSLAALAAANCSWRLHTSGHVALSDWRAEAKAMAYIAHAWARLAPSIDCPAV